MAILIPKFNSNTLVSDLSFLQRGYSYGINDTGPWQRFKRSGRNRDVESWAAVLSDANWNVTVTRDVVITTGNDTGYDPNTADYGFSTVEATAGWPFPYVYGTETPEDIWELEPQDDKVDLLSADMPTGSLAPLSEDYSFYSTKQAIQDLLQQQLKIVWVDPESLGTGSDQEFGTAGPVGGSQLGNLSPNTGTGYIFDGEANALNAQGDFVTPQLIHLPAEDYATAKQLYFLGHAGVTDYPVRAPIVRHSLVTSNQYLVQASTLNVGRIISSASMYSIEDVPEELLFQVPTQPAPEQFIVSQGDLQYGWRKIDPAISRLNRQKWRTQQNYIFGLWPVVLFGLPL